MKKHIALLLVFGLSSLLSNAQIKGCFSNKNLSTWSLRNVEGVNIPLHADSLGNFNLNISKLEKGLYSLGNIETLYLEPDFNLEIIQHKTGYIFKGKGSEENNQIEKSKLPLHFLNNPTGIGLPMYMFVMPPDQFIAIVDKYKKGADQLFSSSKNTFFSTLLSQDAEFLRINIINNFTRFYGMDSIKSKALSAILKTPIAQRTPDHSQLLAKAYKEQFVKTLTAEERNMLNNIMYKNWSMNQETLFKNSDEYRSAIKNRINYGVNDPKNKKILDSLKSGDLTRLYIISNEVNNNYIASALNYQITGTMIKQARTTSSIQSVYDHFMNSNNSSEHKKGIEILYNNLKGTEKNAQVPDFNYVNSDGKFITLASLRGKYVYIDIWATWCVPCLAEIPDLKKLEERYKDKNIHFVSISVDKAIDKVTWLKYVNEYNLKGIQLIADKDFSSDFIKKFGINAIPRFLLIGPDGSILENDAKRPSNAELRVQLDKLL